MNNSKTLLCILVMILFTTSISLYSQECTPNEIQCSEECGTMFRTCGAGGSWGPWQSTGSLKCQNGQIVFSCVLPIELSDFSIEQRGQKITLTWETRSEIDLDKFEIERQFSGEEFKSLGFVTGYNNPSGGTYNFEDEFSQEVQYYRINAIDFDGNAEYSKIISVQRNTSELLIYPTLVKDLLYISGNIGSFQIFDIYGNFIIQGASNQIDVSSISAGTYFLISDTFSSQFVKVD